MHGVECLPKCTLKILTIFSYRIAFQEIDDFSPKYRPQIKSWTFQGASIFSRPSDITKNLDLEIFFRVTEAVGLEKTNTCI